MLPFFAIDFGTVFCRVAVPPVRDRTKSSFSKFPLPPICLNTGSSNVTSTFALSALILEAINFGGVFSVKLKVLLL